MSHPKAQDFPRSTLTALVRASECPCCGNVQDRASCRDLDRGPVQGDLSICWDCGAALRFGKAMALELLTAADLVSIGKEDGAALLELRRVQRDVRRLRGLP